MRMFLCLLLLATSLSVLSAATCSQCPQDQMCGFIDCGGCQGGSFCTMTVCHPTLGHPCNCFNGDCQTKTCGGCCQDAHCSYTGCTGWVCPPNRLPVRPSAAGAVPCANCVDESFDAGVSQGFITVRRTADMPVRLADLRVNISKTGQFDGAAFAIQNTSAAGLVALVTRWDYSDGLPKDTCSGVTTEIWDSWYTDRSFLVGGGRVEEATRTLVRGRDGRTVQSLVVTIEYAEFEDGSRFGLDVNSVRDALRDKRAAILSTYEMIARANTAGASEAEINHLLDTISSPGTGELKLIRAEKGIAGVLEEIGKIRRLPW